MKRITLIALTAAATWYVTPIIDRSWSCDGGWRPFGLIASELVIGCGWLSWYTADEPNGFWTTRIVLRPPSIRWDYLSHAWSDVLNDDRAWKRDDPEAAAWKQQFRPIKDADDAKTFEFPKYRRWR